jgi:hypothetical protein
MTKNEELIEKLTESSLKMVKATYNLIKLYKLENTQTTLNWLDELNKISVL